MIEGVLITPLKIIDTPGGVVMHGMKCCDPGFNGFGEAYFSTCKDRAVKAWKRHCLMTLNLVVPVGSIRFVLYDERPESSTYDTYQEVILSPDNYARLTIPPMIWVGFQGLSKGINILLNVADFAHDPTEMERRDINEFEFDWKA